MKEKVKKEIRMRRYFSIFQSGKNRIQISRVFSLNSLGMGGSGSAFLMALMAL